MSRVCLIASDLDGTLAPTYEPLSTAIVEALTAQISRGVDVLVLTDELAERMEHRVVRRFSPAVRWHVHCFSDGGSYGFRCDSRGRRSEYFDHRFSPRERSQILASVADRLKMTIAGPEPDESQRRLGFVLRSHIDLDLNPEEACAFAAIVESAARGVVPKASVSYAGRQVFRVFPFGKSDALAWYLRTKLPVCGGSGAIPPENVLILGDQSGRFRGDWRLFLLSPAAMRIDVAATPHAAYGVPQGVLAVCELDPNGGLANHHFVRHLLALLYRSPSNSLSAALIRKSISAQNQSAGSISGFWSFDGNRSLARRWLEDLSARGSSRVGRHGLDCSALRYPMLPEEHWLALLPIAKRVLKHNARPVFVRRGTLPLFWLWNRFATVVGDILQCAIPTQAISFKPGSFEASPLINPEYLRHRLLDQTLEHPHGSTLASLLTEDELTATLDRATLSRLEILAGAEDIDVSDAFTAVGMPTRHSLLSCVDSHWGNNAFLQRLAFYYRADVFQVLRQMRSENCRWSWDAFRERIRARSTEQDWQLWKTLLEQSPLGPIPSGVLSTWTDLWAAHQAVARALFNDITLIRESASSHRFSEILTCLFNGTKAHRLADGCPLVAIDDSAMTGRTRYCFEVVASVLSPRQAHEFGTIHASAFYGNRGLSDFTVSSEVIFPEKELDNYGPLTVSIPTRFFPDSTVVRRAYRPVAPPPPRGDWRTAEALVAHIRQRAGSRLRDAWNALPLRADSSIDAFLLLLLTVEPTAYHEVLSRILVEYSVTANHGADSFHDLGYRFLEFKRGILEEMRAEIRALLSTEQHEQLRGIVADLGRDLIGDFDRQATRIAHENAERQERSLRTLELDSVKPSLRAYFLGQVSYAEVSKRLRSVIVC